VRTFNLPDIGEGLQEAEIVSWHVSPGDHVVADQPLVAIETDKAVVELPSPWAGTVARLHGAIGDVIPVGAPLVDFDGGEGQDAGAIVGTLETGKAGIAGAAGKPAAERSDAAAVPAAERETTRGISPRVRSYAAQQGVDLARVVGTGPHGSIVTGDVDAAIAARRNEDAGYEALKGPRRALALNMMHAGRTVVPATVTDLIDVSAWWNSDADITARVIAAIVAAARTEPALNAWFDGQAMSRRIHDSVDVGLAVDAPDGLFVPVIRNAGGLGRAGIRKRIDDAVEGARARALSPDEMRGATITVSNFGSIAGRHASLVLMPPQVAIVGVGRVEPAVAMDGDAPVRRAMLPVSLTFDHRAVTGGEATRFLAALVSDLQQETAPATD
jgi:2-oxoisovalerate dehydrogenase E2 component (dihydrolipoyl transacylase)